MGVKVPATPGPKLLQGPLTKPPTADGTTYMRLACCVLWCWLLQTLEHGWLHSCGQRGQYDLPLTSTVNNTGSMETHHCGLNND
jgi:hypothetical protein